MPVKEIALLRLAVPVPLHGFPKLRDPFVQRLLFFRRAVKALPGREQALHQERRFDQVSTVIKCAKYRHGLSGIAIHVVRPGTVVSICRLQKTHDLEEAVNGLLASNELAVSARYQDRKS